MSEHIENRNKLKDIADIARFDSLLDRSTLSQVDKDILRMHYLEEKDLRYIADCLGYTESAIKKRHIKEISKLSKLF